MFTAVKFVPASGWAWRMLPPSFIDWSRAVIDAASVRAKKGACYKR
ncbi:hypothetical protein [Nocardia nova]